MPRRKIEKCWIEHEIKMFEDALEKQIEKKGDLSFISTHEVLGVVFEEFQEYSKEVQNNDKEKQLKELHDIMISAFWGIVSIRQAGVEW